MTESASMSNESSTKFVSKTIEPFSVMSETPDSLKLDEKEIHYTLFVNSVTLAPSTPDVKTYPTKMMTCQMPKSYGWTRNQRKWCTREWRLSSTAHNRTYWKQRKNELYTVMKLVRTRPGHHWPADPYSSTFHFVLLQLTKQTGR